LIIEVGFLDKRDVTVVNRNPSDPCPTIVDSNRQVGANLMFGPRITGSFFGQGQSQTPEHGFKSWGGALGAPQLGLMRGFNLGIPIGSKVLPSDCGDQQMVAPNYNVRLIWLHSLNEFGNFVIKRFHPLKP